jgi:biopolymer transport protein ExbB/TolQ
MTQSIFHLFTRSGAEWVMVLLVALSVASIAVILERGVFFVRNGASVPQLLPLLKAGRLDEASSRLPGRRGMEAEVARAALEAADGGPAAVQEAVACAIAESRPTYERGLSFLGTLGNNAPFLGLFGTVIGIIRAFSDLAVGGPRGAGAAAVMAGISEALVATAVGIFVAIPAVVAYNGYMRRLRTLTARGEAVGHALASHLERDEVRARARPARLPDPVDPRSKGAA